MPKQNTHDFLKEFDRFGQPVGLTYKNNASYNTPIGGVFTMLAFFIFMAWLAMELIDVYMPPGKHSVSNSDVITQKLNSSWPIYDLEQDQFFVAYKLRAGPGAPEGVAGNEDKYLSGIWLQRKNGKYADHFTGIACDQIWDPMNVTLMFS